MSYDVKNWLYPIHSKSKIIELDLVPKSAWFANLRSGLAGKDWDLIRNICYQIGGNVCEVCGGKGHKHPVEAHERWVYIRPNVQKLSGVSCLCPMCHSVCHFGLAQVMGRAESVQKHQMKVNKWSEAESDAHIEKSFAIWQKRSQIQWELDVSWLMDSKIELSKKSLDNIIKHPSGFYTFKEKFGK